MLVDLRQSVGVGGANGARSVLLPPRAHSIARRPILRGPFVMPRRGMGAAAIATPVVMLPAPITITPSYVGAIKLSNPADFALPNPSYTTTYDPMTAIGYCFIPLHSWSDPLTGITTNAIWLTSDGKYTPASQVTPAPPQLFDTNTQNDLKNYSEPKYTPAPAPAPPVSPQANTTNTANPVSTASASAAPSTPAGSSAVVPVAAPGWLAPGSSASAAVDSFFQKSVTIMGKDVPLWMIAGGVIGGYFLFASKGRH